MRTWIAALWLLGIGSAALAGSYEQGVQALKSQQFRKAQQFLQQAAREQPDSADAWWELGWAYWQQADIQKAHDAWVQVERIEPDRPELATWLGAAREKLALSKMEPGPVDIPLEPAGEAIWIAAAGDTMMGSDLRRGDAGLPPGDGQSLFESVRPLFEKADLAFVNLEGTLADGLEQTKCGPESTSCYAFRTPTRYAQALVAAGIDVVSNANNHASDLGPAGMESTLAALDRVGIAHASRYGDQAIVERKGIKVGVIAAHSGSCCLNINRIDEIVSAVRKLDRQVDVVVLSFHGGAEGSGARHVPGQVEIGYGEERGDVKKLARAAIDAGADLVLGHGPHVLRAMEVYKNRLIVYSLGNFMGYKQFGMRGGYGGHSVILQVQVAANGVLKAARLHPVRLDKHSIPRPDPQKRALQHVRELSQADFPDTGVTVLRDGRLSW
jgi:tetratricopeptide (TPR) repeat protein